MEIVFKDELGLTIDEYNKPAVYKNFDALGHTIVNLLFLKPGNYPNKPLMGINIEKYKFEFLDDYSLSDLEQNIQEQLKLYIESTDSIIVNLEIIRDEFKRKMLKLNFVVTNKETESEAFTINLKQNEKNDITVEFMM